jgi:hypothetical protein
MPRKTVWKVCPVCEEPFEVPRCVQERHTTCSRGCLREHRKGPRVARVSRICAFCGQSFETLPSRKHQKFCSKSCPGPEIPVWSDSWAHVVGLIAADGYVSANGPQRISVSSKDESIRTVVLNTLPRASLYRSKDGCHSVTCTWPKGHDWLASIGIGRSKSLTLGVLGIPDDWFFSFLRGVHDGDGTTYYERGKYLRLQLSSHAPVFREWVRETTLRLGDIEWRPVKNGLAVYGRNAWRLHDLVWGDGPCLERKRPDLTRRPAGA